jgi:hypothetical protein
VSEVWSVAVPAWLAGGGTLILAAATYLLVRRADDERKTRLAAEDRRTEQSRRAQAASISAWIGGPPSEREVAEFPFREMPITVLNRSDEPVYRVVVHMVFVQGAGPAIGEQWGSLGGGGVGRARSVLTMVPPGFWATHAVPPDGAPAMRLGAEVAFTDRDGVSWVRRSSGQLDEIDADALTHYEIGAPIDLHDPVAI